MTTSDGMTLPFSGAVHRTLVDACMRCHAAGASAERTGFVLKGEVKADLATTFPFVNTDAPARSRLLSKTTGVGHTGGVIFVVGSPAYDLLFRWIVQGATP